MHGTLPGTVEIYPRAPLAVGHHQFEAIYPLSDGIGRTGRALNLLCLVEQRLPDIPVLYLSRHILRNRAEYCSGLQSITEAGTWEPWFLCMLGGVTETVRWTLNRIVAVRGLLDETSERMRRDSGQICSRELAELAFVPPRCRTSHVVEACTGLAPDRKHVPQGAHGHRHPAGAQDGSGEDIPRSGVHRSVEARLNG